MGNLAIGTALTVASGLVSAAGDAKAAAFKASEANAAARAGRIAAAQTDVAMREELSSAVSEIRAIRASANISPDSPTTAAILAEEGRVADRSRRTAVSNILSQAESDERAADFFRRSGRNAFLYGSLSSFGQGFTTLAKAKA